MQIAVRVDASLTIGTGHVMRCLTLAHALRQRQHDVFFICRQLPGDLTDTIQQQGFKVHILTSQGGASDSRLPHANWLPVSQQMDAMQTVSTLEGYSHIDWLIMDHYALDQEWQQIVKPSINRLMVIDDLADRAHLADILLDQNYYPDMHQRYETLLPAHCRRLVGPQWVLLREEFIRLHSQTTPRSGELRNVLIFFGGADNSKLVLHSLLAIESLGAGFDTSVIVHSAHPHRPAIEAIAARHGVMQLFSRVDDMAQRMLDADLAIGGGGTTTWERCYLGLPAIVFTLAHNQAAVNRAVADAGACLHLGEAQAPAGDIAVAINRLSQQPAQLRAMSQAGLDLMQNHRGTEGVVDIMEQLHD